ncbi:MAG: hypothetical protein RhofKO_34760 [Rhodothermales bacterium]
MLLIGLIAAFVAPVQAQLTSDRVQQILDAYIAQENVPGAVLHIESADGNVLTAASGFASLAPEEAVTSAYAFRIGSGTKTFTAALVLLLAEEGYLDIDAAIESYLPGLLPQDDTITPRMLLQHTSGLQDYAGIVVDELAADPTASWAPEELMAIGAGLGLAFEPGNGWTYANTNYVALALLIEAVTGLGFGEAVQTILIEPLGLSTTRPDGAAWPDQVAQGYTIDGADAVNVTDVSRGYLYGGAGLWSSAADLAQWLFALADGDVLGEGAIEAMTDVIDTGRGYGYGLGLMQIEDALGHVGEELGYASSMWYLIEAEVAIVALANTNEADLIPLVETVVGQLMATTGPFDGRWVSEGYGWALDIAGGRGTVYETTAVSRYDAEQWVIRDDVFYSVDEDESGSEMLEPFGTLRLEGDTLILTLVDGTEITFQRDDAWSEVPIDGPTDNAEAAFEVFWHTLNEQFAFFDLHPEVDWQQLYNQYRPQVYNGMPDAELFELMAGLFALLEDGHGILLDPDNELFFSAVADYNSDWMPERLTDLLETSITYLDDEQAHLSGNGRLLHGTVGGRIGYLNILIFQGYAETAFEEAAAFAEALDTVLSGFANMDALILDVRFNPGGDDTLPRLVAQRLIEQETLAFSKHARIGDAETFAPLSPRWLSPDGVGFTGKPVVLLTSRQTGSAGDVQALVLKDLPNVTLVGEPTAGAFSNALPRTLPNGWTLRLSNERYVSRDGMQYEQQGVPPDVAVAPSEHALDAGEDPMLEAALSVLAVALPIEEDSLPTELTLESNYPNPFNPSTTLSFTLGQSAPVTVEVFDALGRRVATLANDVPMHAGRHQFAFDATGMASGLYHYRVQAAGTAQSGVMTLMK